MLRSPLASSLALFSVIFLIKRSRSTSLAAITKILFKISCRELIKSFPNYFSLKTKIVIKEFLEEEYKQFDMYKEIIYCLTSKA